MTTESIEIVQDAGKGKKISATLLNERELIVRDATKRNTIKYTIDIVALNAESRRITTWGWRWFVVGVVVILVTILAFFLLPALSENSLYSILVSMVGVGIGIGCFFLAWKTTSVKQVFFSRNSNVPLVELFVNQPSKNEFNNFAEKMQHCIQAVQQQMDLSQQNQLAGEIKMLRRLSEAGVLSATVYKAAKDDLLSMT